jgi:hypothetical protein
MIRTQPAGTAVAHDMTVAGHTGRTVRMLDGSLVPDAVFAVDAPEQAAVARDDENPRDPQRSPSRRRRRPLQRLDNGSSATSPGSVLRLPAMRTYDDDGRPRTVSDSLADAADASNTVETPTSHDDEIGARRRLGQRSDGLFGIDDHGFRDSADALEAGLWLAIPDCDDGSDVGTKPVAELGCSRERGSGLRRAVHADDNSLRELSRDQRASGDEDRALRVMQQPRCDAAEQHTGDATGALRSDSDEGRILPLEERDEGFSRRARHLVACCRRPGYRPRAGERVVCFRVELSDQLSRDRPSVDRRGHVDAGNEID